MKMKKTAVKIAAFLMIAGSMAITAPALEPNGGQRPNTSNTTIVLRWADTSEVTPSIDADGTTLYPEVYVKAKSTSAKIKGTMYLEKYAAGKWTRVTSWRISGTGKVSLSKSYSGVSGTKYRTRVSVTIGSETVQATSDSCNI